MNILFVCTGNTCRSPMAEAYCRHLCQDRGAAGIDTQSAGIAAADGAPVSPLVRAALAEEGVDLGYTVSQPVSSTLIDWADLVITMTRSHTNRIHVRYPQARGKTHALLSYVDSEADVSDPFGGDLEEYVASLAAMKPALARLAARLSEGRPLEDSCS